MLKIELLIYIVKPQNLIFVVVVVVVVETKTIEKAKITKRSHAFKGMHTHIMWNLKFF